MPDTGRCLSEPLLQKTVPRNIFYGSNALKLLTPLISTRSLLSLVTAVCCAVAVVSSMRCSGEGLMSDQLGIQDSFRGSKNRIADAQDESVERVQDFPRVLPDHVEVLPIGLSEMAPGLVPVLPEEPVGRFSTRELEDALPQGSTNSEPDSNASSSLSLVGLEPFVMKSSSGRPFLIVSESGFVQGIPTPSATEFRRIEATAATYLADCESREAVLIVDFEGEIPGYGGELVSAAFQETLAVNGSTLKPTSSDSHAVVDAHPGLLLDLRSRSCMELLKRVMEKANIMKVMWGSNRDIMTLFYPSKPMPSKVFPAGIVDIQMAFSDPSRPLGMKRMLERVSQSRLSGLPDKKQIDFDLFHSANLRAMPLPLDRVAAIYAVDDLRRIEIIIETQMPLSGSYSYQRNQTDILIMEIGMDPIGLKWLQRDYGWFAKAFGTRKQSKAVEIKRHILGIRSRGIDCGAQEQRKINEIERSVDALLLEAHVTVPCDLSFGS